MWMMMKLVDIVVTGVVWLGLACIITLAPPAWAEKADRRKPLVVDTVDPQGDNKAKVYVFPGKLVLNQGTLRIVADNGELRGDPGAMKAIVKGAPVCFRQKKDGSDEVMRGQAARLEYDQTKEKVEFFNNVVVHDGANEMRGDYVVYYMATEKFEVRDRTPNGAARIVMVPKEKDEADALIELGKDAPKPKLKTSKEIEAGRYEPLASKCIKEAL
jgi:lipopolysaccharide export system protein LptA